MKLFKSITRLARRQRIRGLLRKARALRQLHADGRDLDHFLVLEMIPQQADLRLPIGAFVGLAGGFEEEVKNLLRQVLFADTRASGVWADMMVQLAGGDQKLIMAAPAGWRREFERHGFKVAHGRSIAALFLLQIRGFVRAAATLRRYFRKARARTVPAPNVGYAVFHGMRPFYLPQAAVSPASRWDWISWYRRSPVFDSRIKEIWAIIHEPHSGKDLIGIRTVTHALPDLRTGMIWLQFFVEVLGLTIWSFLRWICGAWWAPLALPYLIDMRYSGRLLSSDLPLQLAFNSTQKTIRPLWTYDLERRGTRVLMFLYSMNNVAFAPRSVGHRFSEPDFCQVSWPEYVVWGEAHAAVLRKIGLRHSRFTVVGAMGFADDLSDEPNLPPGPCVAVFDIEAQRAVDLAAQGFPRPYWDHQTCYHFVEQAFDAIRSLGATPIYKPKGYLGGRFIRPHAAAYDELIRRYDAIVVDGYVNANRLIPRVNSVLSMPFTSTAAAALALSRPTAYFDPTGTLAPFAQLACGIPLLLSKAELTTWLTVSLRESVKSPREQLAT